MESNAEPQKPTPPDYPYCTQFEVEEYHRQLFAYWLYFATKKSKHPVVKGGK